MSNHLSSHLRKIAVQLVLPIVAVFACHPLEPSNDAPAETQLDLRKDDPKKDDDSSSSSVTPRKKDDEKPLEAFAAENEEIGTYKGYAVISNALASRLVEPGTIFDLAFYLDGAGSSEFVFRGELFKLLGSYQSDGLRSDFQNSQPNGINLLVWHLALSGLGDDLGKSCIMPPVTDPAATHPPLALRPQVLATIRAVCTLASSSDAQRSLTLDTFWRTLTGWELPETERVAWLEWARSPELNALKPEEAVSALAEAALFNPHMLLRN